MTIPEGLLDRAQEAYTWNSNTQAVRNEFEYSDLRGPLPPPPDQRQSLRAALEAVAADLYDVGYEAGRFDGECASYTRPEDRPYRASGD